MLLCEFLVCWWLPAALGALTIVRLQNEWIPQITKYLATNWSLWLVVWRPFLWRLRYGWWQKRHELFAPAYNSLVSIFHTLCRSLILYYDSKGCMNQTAKAEFAYMLMRIWEYNIGVKLNLQINNNTKHF